MTYKHIHNRRGFFSDYYLGSIFGRQGGRGRKRRLSDRDTDSAYGRFLRLHERAEGHCKDAADTRERYIRPLLRDVLGFHLGAGEDRVHLGFYSAEEEGDGGAPRLAIYSGDWDEDLDAGRGGARPLAKLEAVLAHRGIQYGLLVTGERLRLVRASGEGPRGACLEADLEGLADDHDPESFAVLYRLLQVSNFLPDETGTLPVEAMEKEMRSIELVMGLLTREVLPEDLPDKQWSYVKEDVARRLYPTVRRDLPGYKVKFRDTVDDVAVIDLSTLLVDGSEILRSVMVTLDKREKRILVLLRAGRSRNEIAAKVGYKGHSGLSRKIAELEDTFRRAVGSPPVARRRTKRSGA